ncbi:MAG: patatin family protein [Bacteroidaceae bacterium]|nr:patatin family protein [Bacteroidaceae bacterium]
MKLEKIGLVLEGGGMRGTFTSGVLDYMMDNDIEVSYGIGVSAGACNGVSYVSHQRGRAKFSNIDLLDKYKYIGINHLIRTGSIINMDMLYNRFTEEILPFDYDSYFARGMRFEMVTTDCHTGEACYMEEYNDRHRLIDIVKASASLPYVCPICYVDERPMLDGGIVDSIPLERAISQGYEKNIVVLTRNKGYRKKEKIIKHPSFVYHQYPQLRQALAMRNVLYNKQLEMIERMEDEGRIIVIRPERPIVVDRMERNVQKLTDLYNEGYACAENIFSRSL